MPDTNINVLYIDDEPVYLIAFRASFRRAYNIFTAGSAMEAMAILKKENIQVIISDNRMPDISGIDFFKSILDQYKYTVRILLTAYRDLQDAIDAINSAHVHKFITKPWDETEMKTVIMQAYDKYLKDKQEQSNLEILDFFVRQKLLSW